MKIKKNSIKCNNCLDIITSFNRHDWVACSCFRDEQDTKGVYVDGGKDYLRRGGNINGYTELSEYLEEDNNDSKRDS